MHTARSLSPPVLPLARLTIASLISRIGWRLKAFLTPRAQTCLVDATSEIMPVTGRVVAISCVEFFDPPRLKSPSSEGVVHVFRHKNTVVSPRNAIRRPGVQGRWKSTDRVAMF
jgi:hypothetical protein